MVLPGQARVFQADAQKFHFLFQYFHFRCIKSIVHNTLKITQTIISGKSNKYFFSKKIKRLNSVCTNGKVLLVFYILKQITNGHECKFVKFYDDYLKSQQQFLIR